MALVMLDIPRSAFQFLGQNSWRYPFRSLYKVPVAFLILRLLGCLLASICAVYLLQLLWQYLWRFTQNCELPEFGFEDQAHVLGWHWLRNGQSRTSDALHCLKLSLPTAHTGFQLAFWGIIARLYFMYRSCHKVLRSNLVHLLSGVRRAEMGKARRTQGCMLRIVVSRAPGRTHCHGWHLHQMEE